MNERDRIEMIMKSYALTPSQFADKAGVQRASISHILSGRNKPSLEVMLKIYEAFPGLDMQWLMTGKGNAPVAGAVEPAEMAAQPSVSVQSELFPSAAVAPAPVVERRSARTEQQIVSVVERTPKRAARTSSHVPVAPSPAKKIKEIRIFYTDGTYETMVPEK